ncbi:glutaminase A [Pseudomonas sp. N040]|uniref:glutaminase A n=1 Tax=Pseudomonas sp. N040 TaxID=2785325 RepID=UPI0018A32AE2|nr:glutaminase A [Pseudomonas sp. N040]MBF7728760.1 glutaminase A [Pseudomonas sp. N040]MBW7012400.1 glutaminase A [Pseudomonas sp. N040]
MKNDWLQPLIDQMYAKHLPHNAGEVASYIPELGKANPNDFGISLATADGQIFEAGDSTRPFTIQSISKPFTYGMAIELHGHAKVSARVGVEPSGDVFNSIQLEKDSHRPFNPMINAGAITVSALLYEHYGDEALEQLLARFSAAAGHPLSVDEAVYQSEKRTGHRNRAIAHLLLNFGMVEEKVEQALDLYFKQCSILVNTRDLAVMGATLSNLGKNPFTGVDVYDIDRVKDMLSIMFTCGLYDYSGEWAYKVGVPAKSGVSGGVMSVVNRQLGFATYSPRLDARGNSCRGIEVCVDLANELGLHVFDCMNMGSSYLKAML